MTITLTYRNLMMLGLNGTLEKNGITLKIERPVLTTLNEGGNKGGSVLFYLDMTDPRALEASRELP